MKQQTISSFYEADHDRIDGLFKQFQSNKYQDFKKARGFFFDFKTGLERHILWEEGILFPLFEEKTGMDEEGPIGVMRFEHVRILEFLEDLHEKLRQGNSDTEGEEDALLQILEEHNMKEEEMLYPMIDRLVSERERRAVFLKMEEPLDEKSRPICE